MRDLGWVHRFEAGGGAGSGSEANLTLLLLHGTGGNETSLLRLGRQVAPGANLLSVRGRSDEEGIARFFRRFTATRYDQEHLASEADALAGFIDGAASEYGFARGRVVAVGYSNGANIAVAMLARHPSSVAGAALLRPVMPLENPPTTDLTNVKVLVLHGTTDPYAAAAGALTPYLEEMNAAVTERHLNAGHELTRDDLELLSDWLRTEYS